MFTSSFRRLCSRTPSLPKQYSPISKLPIPNASIRARYLASTGDTPAVELKKTPLYDLHLHHNAKMVPFAGYSMPVGYAKQGMVDSHNHVREQAGLFDVSHMVQHRFEGPDAQAFLQYVTPNDLAALPNNTSTLSLFLNPQGGIVDDLMITRLSPEAFYVVTNAACEEKDLAYIKEHMSSFKNVSHTVLNNGLLALQGPASSSILSDFLSREASNAPRLEELYFGTALQVETQFGELQIARGGYTGEDGFEISVPAEASQRVAEALLREAGDKLKLIGLGVRDSLRLEAGMCLYGHDLNDTTTPLEAGFKWLVDEKRVKEGDFLGAETVQRQYASWKEVERRRVGFVVQGPPAREGTQVVGKGEVVGEITSGCPSTTLGKNIAMGYVKSGFHKVGTELGVLVRGKERPAVVTKMPFVAPKYYRPS